MSQEHELAERAEWISERLAEYGEGVHRLGEPALLLDSELPVAVASICREFNGAELFHEGLILFAVAAIHKQDTLFVVAVAGGDEIMVDAKGVVWRLENDTEELVPEGTRFDRWLAGAIEAEAVLYDTDGEFRDGVFDEDGELSNEAEAERAKRQLKRDPKSIAPRWRLARALMGAGRPEKARDYLEDVVEAKPDFPWAWFDLSRISEELGQMGAASEEAEQAARAKEGYEHAAFFLAHAARLAQLAGEDARYQSLATEVLRIHPELPGHHIEAARERLAAKDQTAARELLVLAKVVAPRNLQVLDLLAQLEN